MVDEEGFDIHDRDLYPFEIPETYALFHFDPVAIHLVIFSKKDRVWRIIGDFKGCSVVSLLGRRFVIEAYRKRKQLGIFYIRHNEMRVVFEVHITE